MVQIPPIDSVLMWIYWATNALLLHRVLNDRDICFAQRHEGHKGIDGSLDSFVHFVPLCEEKLETNNQCH